MLHRDDEEWPLDLLAHKKPGAELELSTMCEPPALPILFHPPFSHIAALAPCSKLLRFAERELSRAVLAAARPRGRWAVSDFAAESGATQQVPPSSHRWPAAAGLKCPGPATLGPPTPWRFPRRCP